MIHILVVDDEPHIANGVRRLIAEHNETETRVWKAMSVKQAISIFEHNRIDLLVTDIQMPGMTGLDLVNLVQEQWKNCRVMFLTGYSDYEYLQFALQKRVVEYVLKPVEDDVLLDKISNVLEQIKMNSHLEQWRQKSEQQLLQAKPLLISELMRSLLNHEGNDLTKLGEQIRNLQYDISFVKPVMLMIGRIDCWPDNYSVKDKLLMEYAINNMMEECVSSSIKVLPCSYQRHLIWVFQSTLDEMDEYKLFIQISEVIDVLQQSIFDMLHLKVSFIMSPYYIEWSKLGYSYEYLVSVLKKGIGLEQEFVIAHTENAVGESLLRVTVADMKQSIRRMLSYLESVHIDQLKQETTLFFQKFSASVFVEYSLQLEVFCALSSAVLEYINEKNIYSELGKIIRLDILVNYNEIENLESWERYCHELFEAIITIIEQKGINHKYEISEQVDTYIESHLDGDLSLTNLAKQVYLSPYYLSRLYYAERGYHLSDKITELKVVKAKEMLVEGSMKIYEIAVALGYENMPYFSRFFKKQVGVTPQQYKESNRIS